MNGSQHIRDQKNLHVVHMDVYGQGGPVRIGAPNHIFFDNEHVGTVFEKPDGTRIETYSTSVAMFSWRSYVDLEYRNTVDTTHTSNYFVNKQKDLNRWLLLKMVEIFQIPACYYYSAIKRDENLQSILDELDQIPNWQSWLSIDDRCDLLSPCQTPRRWPFGDVVNHDDTAFNHNLSNAMSWPAAFCDLFSSSAISLITESTQWPNASRFSYKTIYSVLGLTMPIWIGGYGQADAWKKLGFDVFDDVIDHSYQYAPTLIQRCWQAIEQNKHLLVNLDLARSMRDNHLDRLLENRHHFLSGRHMDTITVKIQAWPEQVRIWLKQQLLLGKFDAFDHDDRQRWHEKDFRF
jgi:hypothetical protein